MRIHYLQHEDAVSLGSIQNWLLESGHQCTGTCFQRNEVLPSIDDFDGLIILGGAMSAYDEGDFPWLVSEKTFIRRSIKANKRVLGICLGAQLIADSLGKKVFPNPLLEVGWFDIRRFPEANRHSWVDEIPASVEVFHWHGDTFDLPDGAVRLASSDACLNQAYALGDNVLAIQFHLETTSSEAQGWIKEDIQKLAIGPFVQSPAEILKFPERFERSHRLLSSILDRFFGSNKSGSTFV